MKLELTSAANFIAHLIRLKKLGYCEPLLHKFRNCLIDEFRRRYQDHWFPEHPLKGSGYRCVRLNGRIDPLVNRAAEACNLLNCSFLENFPILTMWINPFEVCYRFGENGAICILIDKDTFEPWTHKPPKKRTIRKNQIEPINYTEPVNCTIANKSPKLTIEYLLDTHQHVSIEHLLAYVLE